MPQEIPKVEVDSRSAHTCDAEHEPYVLCVMKDEYAQLQVAKSLIGV